jgi:hypothetical protein
MSWLRTELREQPQALARLLERQADSVRTAALLFRGATSATCLIGREMRSGRAFVAAAASLPQIVAGAVAPG